MALLLLVAFCAGDVSAKDLFTGNQHWEKVELLGNYSGSDPLFSDTSNVRQTLIKDTYGWIQGIADGYTFSDKLQLILSTTEVQYDLEPTGFVNEVLPVKIKAVRRLSPLNLQSLTSTSIHDLNKVNVETAYPEIYAYDRSHLYIHSYPAAVCTLYVWAQRTANTDSTTLAIEAEQAGARKPVLMTNFRPILWLRTVALAKEKEGNMVASQNIKQISEAMIADLLQIYQMIEVGKDIRVAPQLYEE